MDGWVCGRLRGGGWMDGWTVEGRDGWMGGRLRGWMDGLMGGWTVEGREG